MVCGKIPASDHAGRRWRRTPMIHHKGYGTFVVDRPTIKLKSKMRL
jgi:hypothetical protein